MEVLVAQVFHVVLLIVCNLSVNRMTQSCADAPIEANSKAENLFSNRPDEKNLVRALCMRISFLLHSG